MPVLRVLVGLVGATLVVGVVTSAMRTVVLPRGEPVRLTGLVFLATRTAFDAAVLDAAGMMASVGDLSQVERRSDAHVEADDGVASLSAHLPHRDEGTPDR